ncbi:UTP--glucose-1-phosphate uridylyltransferase OS=Streptomyces glaucescens OX=1907 GN=SGLAU_14525 PE=3 SV=1 [Streptomyces glaucescens]
MYPLLWASKATPKEMLPVVDKPVIEYVVEEAVSAGLDDVLMVMGRNKRPLEDDFDRNDELESALEKKGDAGRLAKVQEFSDLATMHYVRQGDPRASATPSCAPPRTSATSPSPSSSATT